MKKAKQSQSEFKFLYTKGDPNSLVMLRNRREFIKQKLQIKIHYVLIGQQNIFEKINTQLKIQLGGHYNLFQDTNNAKKFIDKNVRQKKQIVLLYHKHKMSQEIQKIVKSFKGKRIAYDEQQGEKFIKEVKQDCEKNNLYNFLFIREDSQETKLYLQTIFMMLKTQQFREDLMKQLQLLIKQIPSKKKHPQQDKIEFIQMLKKKKINDKQAIKWYSKECFLYHLISKILRTCRDPSEIFYIQPFFKILFNAIYRLYSQQRVKKESFKCYRGGKIKYEQARYLKENIKNHPIIRNLGFLSTSKLQKKTTQFMSNTIFEITINQQHQQLQCDYGYADVTKFSQYYEQQEVLFNPLNSFEVTNIIEEFYQEKQVYRVFLTYGRLSSIVNLSEDQRKQKQIRQFQLYYQTLAHYQNSRIYFIKSSLLFGNLLFNQYFALNGCQIYWKKFIQISQKIKNQIQNGDQNELCLQIQQQKLLNIVRPNIFNEQIIRSQEFQKDLIKIRYPQLNGYYNLGRVYLLKQQYGNASQCFQQCIRKVQKLKIQNNLLQLQIVENLYHAYNCLQLPGQQQKYEKKQKMEKLWTLYEKLSINAQIKLPYFKTQIKDNYQAYQKKIKDLKKYIVDNYTENSVMYFHVLCLQNQLLINNMQFNEVEKNINEGLVLAYNIYGIKHMVHVRLLQQKALLKIKTHKFQQTISLFQQIIKIKSIYINQPHIQFAKNYYYYAKALNFTGQSRKALQYINKAQFNSRNVLQYQILSMKIKITKAYIQLQLHDYSQIDQILVEVEDIINKQFNKFHPIFINIHDIRAKKFKMTRRYNQAIEQLNIAAVKSKKMSAQKNQCNLMQAKFLTKAAQILIIKSQFQKAVQYIQKCQNLLAKQSKNSNFDQQFLKIYSLIGQYLFVIGKQKILKQKKQNDLIESRLKIKKQLFNISLFKEAQELYKIGVIFFDSAIYQKAEEKFNQAYQIAKKNINKSKQYRLLHNAIQDTLKKSRQTYSRIDKEHQEKYEQMIKFGPLLQFL